MLMKRVRSAENASRNMENEIRAFTTAVQAWKLLIGGNDIRASL